MGKRLTGLDFGRGLAVLGMVFCHSFMGQVTGWNSTILFDLASKTPIVLLVAVFCPVVVFCLMGSLFSFITAICVTMSSIKIAAKGGNLIWRYVVMKLVFAFVIKFLEDFWGQWLNDYNIFKDERFGLPNVSLLYWSHTLDDVGFFSWFIPIVVYGLSKVPRLDYRAQMAILTVIGVILLQFNDVTIFYCRELGSWFRSHEFYFFYYLTTKLDNGAFAILQYLPFGFFGGAFGLLFTNTKDVKHYWVYCGILSGLCIVCGIPNLFGDAATLVQDVFGWIKPKSYLFFMGAIQSIAMMICLQLADNPKRPVEKRYRTIKRTTFLRRINALSLTAYIVEPRYNRTVLLFFRALFGEGADRDKGTCLWPWYICLLYMLSCATLWAIICRLWERGHFRFSMEHQLSCIMSWLFQQPYNKMDYKANIYGPVEEIKQELAAQAPKKEGDGQQEAREVEVVVQNSA